MGLLQLAVLGPPEVYHDGHRLSFALRKAQALLLYLAVEGDLHPRSKLAAFLWPDSEPHDARKGLRNAITLLRRLLADLDPSAPAHSHLLSEHELFGLDPHAQLALDLEVVQQAYQQAQRHSTVPSQEQRAALVTQVQHALALVRGPFLDGFWLREETGFDEWVQQHQQQWQVRLQLLCERLSAWQEAGGELEPAHVTLTRWLALDPLQEEAYRRLMRVQLALGDASAALQVYATLRARLAEELRVKPSADTMALAEHIRATATRSRGTSPARRASATAGSQPPGELVAPLVGRAAAFSQFVGGFQQARQGQPQTVLVVGEAGIGKTRLATEFVAWACAQGAEVLSGHAFEMGGRLPYQPVVEALRSRLEKENAPEDLHWVDGASLDLLRYLGHAWSRQGSRVLLLAMLRTEGWKPQSQLAAQLADLGRDLPVSQVRLPPLSQAQTLQLLEAIIGEEYSTSSGGEQREHGPVRACTTGPGAHPSPEQERPLFRLGDFLFAQTGGQPLYLLETLKLLRERRWLVPQLGADGTWKLEPTQDLAVALTQDQTRRELVAPSVRALSQARLAKLTQPARRLVMAAAVLGTQATAAQLWQVAELGVQVGVEALEEAEGLGGPATYRFAHELMREVVYTELGEARRQVLDQRVLALLQTQEARASELAYHARACGEAEAYTGYLAHLFGKSHRESDSGSLDPLQMDEQPG